MDQGEREQDERPPESQAGEQQVFAVTALEGQQREALERKSDGFGAGPEREGGKPRADGGKRVRSFEHEPEEQKVPELPREQHTREPGADGPRGAPAPLAGHAGGVAGASGATGGRAARFIRRRSSQIPSRAASTQPAAVPIV